MSNIHVGDIGTLFKVTMKDQDGVVVSLSGATSLQVKFQKPDESVIVKTASLFTDGTDGIVTYTTQSGDLDQPGAWKLQAVVAKGGGQWSSDLIKFKVAANIG